VGAAFPELQRLLGREIMVGLEAAVVVQRTTRLCPVGREQQVRATTVARGLVRLTGILRVRVVAVAALVLLAETLGLQLLVLAGEA
jgi:hypothetical protein